MAEQAIVGAIPEPQTDARLLEAKQQVGLIPGLEASTSTQTLPGFTSTPGFSLPVTPIPSQPKQGATPGSASHESSHQSTPAQVSSTARHETAMSQQPLDEQQHQQRTQLLSKEDHTKRHHVQPLQQYVGNNTGEEARAGQTAVLPFRDWQGPLCVLSHKGEELICHLKTDTWPAHLPRYVYLCIFQGIHH